MQMDRVEKNLRDSGRVLQDPKLNAFLKGLTCRLEPAYCDSIRIYVVDVPYFNATMSPNGMMQVWTGLLLRAENEAQVAFVVGHELAHYVRRHSLQRWVDIKNKANSSQILTMLSTAAGVGYVGDLGQLAAIASILAFSREQEREADVRGSSRAMDAGYDPKEAVRIWQALREERVASKRKESWIFLSTHPGIDERITRLKTAARAAPDAVEWRVGKDTFAAAVAPHLDEWLGDELTRGAYAESEVVIRRLLESGRKPGLLHFYLGELYRKRSGEDDLDKAIAAYRLAIEQPAFPPRTYRSLGQALIRAEKPEQARRELERYVEAMPEAADRPIIEYQINALR